MPDIQQGGLAPNGTARRARLVIGTRGSPLALAQAHETQNRLSLALGWDVGDIALDIIRVTGDAILDRPLSEAGGKGLFTKELDTALLAGTIDLAVHSAKDLPTALPDGLVIAGYLPREDARDALISPNASSIAGLPAGTVVGSASLRRQAMLLRARPDLSVTLLRGNVGTRLAKVERGEIGATLLAIAGLKRLGLAHHAAALLDPHEFIPAVGQGAIAIMTREDDDATRESIARICDATTAIALAAERAFLAVLDGSCRTPIAGHALVRDGRVSFSGLVLSPDGRVALGAAEEGAGGDADAIGHEAGLSIRARLPAGILPA